MNNADTLYESLTAQEDHLLASGPNINTLRRLIYLLEVGPAPLSSIIEPTCGRQDCVSPAHAKVGEPRNPTEQLDGVRVSEEQLPYFEAVRAISAHRGFQDDVFTFKGFAAGLMFLARGEARHTGFPFSSREEREEYAAQVNKLREELADMEFLTGVSVIDAMDLASVLRTKGPPILDYDPNAIKEPRQRSEDVSRLMQLMRRN